MFVDVPGWEMVTPALHRPEKDELPPCPSGEATPKSQRGKPVPPGQLFTIQEEVTPEKMFEAPPPNLDLSLSNRLPCTHMFYQPFSDEKKHPLKAPPPIKAPPPVKAPPLENPWASMTDDASWVRGKQWRF